MSDPHWSPEVPTQPGRYFYRDPEDDEYGICLVAWSRGMVHRDLVRQPALEVRTLCIFSSTHQGENDEHPNWSYTLGAREQSLVYWTEPLKTPPEFPEISGRPPDVAPEVIQKEKAKSTAQAKANAKEKRKRERERKKVIAKAVSAGADLYECEVCEGLLSPEDRVVGKMRECPHCCTEFVESDDGRNCPDCNRPFTRLSDEKQTCPNCRDDGELPDLVVVVEGGVVQ